VERIQKIARQTRLTFVITNNHYEGKAIANAIQLKFLSQERPVSVPRPMLRHYPQLAAITSKTETNESLFPLS
jgi:uncharacterized protein YecE (DUF72 family)